MRPFQAVVVVVFALMCIAVPPAALAQQGRLDKAVQILEQQARAGKGEFVTFLMGAASAYRWDSAAGDAPGVERLFCPPPWHSLDGKSYAKIALDEYRRSRREYAALTEYPLDVLSLALQRGLRERFPCAAEREARPGRADLPG